MPILSRFQDFFRVLPFSSAQKRAWTVSRTLHAPTFSYPFISIAFFGHAPAQIPHSAHFSSSSSQIFSFRSTRIASCGHFFAQSVQYTHFSASITGLPACRRAVAGRLFLLFLRFHDCVALLHDVRFRIAFLHGQAFLRAGQHAASALHAVEPADGPCTGLAVHLDRQGRTGSRAQAAGDAVLNPDRNVPAHPLREFHRFKRILYSCRLFKEVSTIRLASVNIFVFSIPFVPSFLALRAAHARVDGQDQDRHIRQLAAFQHLHHRRDIARGRRTQAEPVNELLSAAPLHNRWPRLWAARSARNIRRPDCLSPAR